MAADVGDSRVCQNNARATLSRIFHPTCSHRVVAGWIGANHEDQVSLRHIAHRIADRAGAHTFEQSRDTGGMTQAGAMVDVVAAKPGAHQFLKEIRFFVAAFGRTEPGQRFGTVLVSQSQQSPPSNVQGFVPRGFAKNIPPVQALGQHGRVFGCVGLANQGHRQTFWAVHIVKTESTLDTQSTLIGGAISTRNTDDFFFSHVVSDLAADPTKWAYRINRPVY